MQLNSDEIQQILPHRYPFLLVDRITECEPGKKACGIKCVSANEMHFVGHFPQKKVMPGVLIIEALAQTGAVALLSEEKNKGHIALFAGIKNAKFKAQVTPGDVLSLSPVITTLTWLSGSRALKTKWSAMGLLSRYCLSQRLSLAPSLTM